MTINDIPMWIIFRGIGHICMARDTYSMTACGQWGNFHTFATTRPAGVRVCAACRATLGKLKPVGKTEGTA
jgi:hypothetical protein